MSGLPGPASDFVDEVMTDTRDLMIELFGISLEEAEGRIASAFGSLDLLDESTELYLGHYGADYWAKTLYYGDVKWWLVGDLSTLEPKPWP